MSEGIASSTEASKDGLRGNVVNLLAATAARCALLRGMLRAKALLNMNFE